MALKTLSSFSIFPPNSTSDRRPATQIRVSVSHGDDDRYESTRSASDTNEPANPTSKPSKNPNPKFSHPAFRRISRVSRRDSRVTGDIGNGVSVGDDGVSYRIPDAPFEFQYSYTETPKVKPLALREPPFVPFGPSTMPRPWTGRAPLPPSKKKLPEFDSFRLPPPHKKGVKSVQAPGPYLAGSGPKYVKSREEILGEPLTGEEITELVRGNLKTRKQLNMGRDGLTHNMLDNIHAHWKRRRVCKIKCIGVCTVDMDNVRQQLEEKTGGKIIYSRGGVLFLFRGRNYNYKTRPRFPIMLWKPVTPVYPRLVQQVPEGLTLEEASEMRKRGRKLSPICKLGKNGVYSHLVKHVREAFEVCELVRINCKGMNGSDYKKIGGKLKDLVPCVLISFEYEHILMWRGRDWKSSLPKPEDGLDEASESTKDDATANSLYTTNTAVLVGRQETIEVDASKSLNRDESPEDVRLEDISHPERNDQLLTDPYMCPSSINSNGSASSLNSIESTDELSAISEWTGHLGLVTASDSTITHNDLSDASGGQKSLREPALPPESIHSQSSTMSSGICTEGVLLLWRQAIESGSALVLDDASLDANIVYERAVALAKAAPPGPVFRHRIRKVVVQKGEKQKYLDVEVVAVSEKRSIPKNSRNQRGKDFTEAYPDVVSHGSLRVDELAKLLA